MSTRLPLRMKLTAWLVALIASLPAIGQPAIQPDPDNAGLDLPEGFAAVKVAEDLGRGRHAAVRDNGDVFVSLQQKNNGGGIVALRDTDGDGRADEKQYFGDLAGTGLLIHDGYLYASEMPRVVRFPLGDDLVPGPMEQVVVDLPPQRQHEARAIAIDNQGRLYVAIGAPSNACMEQTRTKGSQGMYPCPQLKQHAGIWRFTLDGASLPMRFGQGQRFATGLRHCVAMAWNPVVNELYAVPHGRDQLHQFYPEKYSVEDGAELPAEEFHLLREGSNAGWPYTYWDWRQNKRIIAPEYAGRNLGIDPAQYQEPIQAFPGHWAPNDLLFYTGQQFPQQYRGGAFVAFHGSWNRAPLPQRGYKVTFTPFNGQRPSGDYAAFADAPGFTGRPAGELRGPGQAEHRPCGLAQGPDGSLYIVDSQQGDVWRVIYVGDRPL